MNRRSESGNALLMVTLVSIALATALVVLSNKVKMRSQTLRSMQIKEAREKVFKNLRTIITTPTALKASTAPQRFSNDGNRALANCLEVSSNPDCTATGATSFVGFELYDEFLAQHSSSWPESLRTLPINSEGRWPEQLLRFTGLPLPNIRFDRNARRCLNSATCPLVPFTAFRAWCPQPIHPLQKLLITQFEGGGANRKKSLMTGRPERCDQAEYIQFFIAVGGGASASQLGAAMPLLPVKTRHNFQMSSPSHLGSRPREPDEILMSTVEINSNGARRCPPGMSTIGLDSNGLPRCEYAINPCVVTGAASAGLTIASSENGRLICRKPLQGESCADTEVFFGVSPNGTLICRKPKFDQTCKRDQVVVAFDNKGEAICENAQANKVCPRPAVLVGFDADGIAVCKNAEVMFAGIPIVPYWLR